MTIGERIQKQRKVLGMSQDELGKALFVSRQTISLWEKDQTVPTIDNLIRLRDVFGVSIDEILGFEASETIFKDEPNEKYRFAYTKEELKELHWLKRRIVYKKTYPFFFDLYYFVCVPYWFDCTGLYDRVSFWYVLYWFCFSF